MSWWEIVARALAAVLLTIAIYRLGRKDGRDAGRRIRMADLAELQVYRAQKAVVDALGKDLYRPRNVVASVMLTDEQKSMFPKIDRRQHERSAPGAPVIE